ncbi:MAG: M28 family peptidase [Chloroflexi bacterium]|nr:M28 family peptidase [Chloroflexota bacterium]
MNILKTSTKKPLINFLMIAISFFSLTSCQQHQLFDEQRAFSYLENQLSFGYRLPGSQASMDTSLYIQRILKENDWEVEFQEFEYEGVQIRNIVASNIPESPYLIIGAHYDTRQFSDQEVSDNAKLSPVPGANDGASGTAVLLELSNHLKDSNKSIQLVFFDAEDQGNINGWPWSLGAEYFAGNLEEYPEKVVIVDMVGDKDLNIFLEKNSDPELSKEIWSIAQSLEYGNAFIDQPKYAMIDDHIPFINLGIPSALLIDFDYPYWHTNEDTPDKVSAQSLRIVGEVLLKWISDSH